MKWFNNIILETENVRLIPLKEEHAEALTESASDGELWKLWYTSVPDAGNMSSYIAKALSDYEQDKGMAFTVVDKRTNLIIGTTRYCNATPEHRRLEIGYTWYAKSYHKTHVNSECKLLLLKHAFEKLEAVAVEFRTNWHNHTSRTAIMRLGAKQDGILRNHQILPDGTLRDTVVFSIIESEWNSCKKALIFKIGNIHALNSI